MMKLVIPNRHRAIGAIVKALVTASNKDVIEVACVKELKLCLASLVLMCGVLCETGS